MSSNPVYDGLTDQQTAFIKALFGPAQYDFKKAKELAGYSEETSLAIVMASDKLKTAILDAAQQLLAVSSVKAAATLMEALDSGKNGNPPTTLPQMNAAKEILDRVGIAKKEQVTVTTDGRGAIFILPNKN